MQLDSVSVEPETPCEILASLFADAQIVSAARLRMARWLLRAERAARAARDGWTAFGVTSFAQLCEERLNMPAGEGFQLRMAALGCEKSEELAARVENGSLSLAKAAAVAAVLRHVEAPGRLQRLLDFAALATTKQTRSEAARIKEEARTGLATLPVTLHLTVPALEDLNRARDILTDARGGPRPTDSHAVTVALAEYVERHCPERKAKRAAERARKPAEQRATRAVDSGPLDPVAPLASERESAEGAPGPEGADTPPAARPRRIPAAEQHKVVLLRGDFCWLNGCDERGALQFAHDRHFRFKGENAAHNLARWCLEHHRQFDAGILKVRQGKDGPIVVDVRGRVVGRVRPPNPP